MRRRCCAPSLQGAAPGTWIQLPKRRPSANATLSGPGLGFRRDVAPLRAACGGRARERWSAAFDDTDDAYESVAATTTDVKGVVVNPLLKRDALRRGRDPGARDNGDDKDKEEDVA